MQQNVRKNNVKMKKTQRMLKKKLTNTAKREKLIPDMNEQPKKKKVNIPAPDCIIVGAAMHQKGYPITADGVESFFHDAAVHVAKGTVPTSEVKQSTKRPA